MGEKVEGVRLAFIKKRFSIHGGAERYLQTLIGHLKKTGYEIHILSNQWEEEEDVIFHKINMVPLGSFLSIVTFNENVEKVINRDIRPDCTVSFERTTCQDIYRAGDGCHAEWLKIRAKVEPGYKRLSFKFNPLHVCLLHIEKEIFSNTGLIIANSKMVKNQIIEHYAVPEERIIILYNGVDLRRFSPENRGRWRFSVRKNLSVPDGSKLLLFVGSGFRRKGLKTLIDSLSLVKEKNIKLLVIGKDNKDDYAILAKRHGISDRIVFLEPQKEIEKFYAAADVFVLPTIYDPFSNATLEAMASGLPVVTTVNNGASEIIEEGTDGFILYDILDYNELARMLELVFLSNLSMGENARRKAEKYPIEDAAEEFTRILERFIDRSDGRLKENITTR